MDKILRQLARNSHWQNVYQASKENAGIYLFENQTNFSAIQIRFLYWLAIYYMLYEELAKIESDFLSEKVIEDDIRCDAYLHYRKKIQEYKWKKYRREEKINDIKNKHPKKHAGKNTTLIDVDLRSE